MQSQNPSRPLKAPRKISIFGLFPVPQTRVRRGPETRVSIHMNKMLIAVCFAGCATVAPTQLPTRPGKSYQHVLVVGDAGHRYTLRWSKGTKVSVKSLPKVLGQLRLGISVNGGYVSSQVTFVSDGKDTVLAVLPSHDTGAPEAGRYSLEVEPGPEVEVKLPATSAEDALAHRNRYFEAAREQGEKRENVKRWREQIETQKATVCANEKNGLYAAIRENGLLTYRFCDGTDLTVRGAKTSVGRSLGGSDYESFVGREKSVLQVAEHNVAVLGTPEWHRRAGEARAAFEARVSLFISKYRKPEGWYVAEARRSKLPLVGE